MAKKSRAQFEKRQKELARQERQKSKHARKVEARERKLGEAPGEDPDIAGIQLGPQPEPPSDDLDDVDDVDNDQP